MIERYFDGFRRTDHVAILDCLTEDVVWDLPGFKHLVGKAAFNGEIDNDGFIGSPTLVVDRTVGAWRPAALLVAPGPPARGRPCRPRTR